MRSCAQVSAVRYRARDFKELLVRQIDINLIRRSDINVHRSLGETSMSVSASGSELRPSVHVSHLR